MSAGLGHCPAKWPTTAEAASGWGLAVRGTLISLEHPGGLADKVRICAHPPLAKRHGRVGPAARIGQLGAEPTQTEEDGELGRLHGEQPRPPADPITPGALWPGTNAGFANYPSPPYRRPPCSPPGTALPSAELTGPSSPSVAASTRLPARQAMVLSYDATYDEAAEVSYDRSPDPYTNRLADGTYVVRGGRAANRRTYGSVQVRVLID